MTKITNPLHIGAPFTIIMLVYDEKAKVETDLNAITSSIQITQ